jgi:hypothetical protein
MELQLIKIYAFIRASAKVSMIFTPKLIWMRTSYSVVSRSITDSRQMVALGYSGLSEISMFMLTLLFRY